MPDFLYNIALLYILFYGFLFVRMSVKGGIFIMNPLFSIHAVTFSIASYIVFENGLEGMRPNVQYVYLYALITSIITLLIFRKQLFKKVNIEIPYSWKVSKITAMRNAMFVISVAILLMMGMYKGVTQGLLSSADVEGLRADTLAGTGWITSFPQIFLYIYAYVYCIGYLKNRPIIAGLLCAFLGLLFFLVNGFRADMLKFAILFLVYFSVCHRNLKWYEYFIFMSIIPIMAAITGIYRSAGVINKQNISEYSYDIHSFDRTVMSYFEGDIFFGGEEYYKYGASYIIPRFLWAGKPTTFANDVMKKKVMDLNFPGGGVAYSNPVSTFVNFGYYGFIAYFLWLVFLHILYGKIIDDRISPYYKILLLIYLGRTTLLSGQLVIQFYVIFLSSLTIFFVYRKKRVL